MRRLHGSQSRSCSAQNVIFRKSYFSNFKHLLHLQPFPRNQQRKSVTNTREFPEQERNRPSAPSVSYVSIRDSSNPPSGFHTNNPAFVGDFHPSMAFLFLRPCGLVGDLARVQTVKRIPAFAKPESDRAQFLPQDFFL